MIGGNNLMFLNKLSLNYKKKSTPVKVNEDYQIENISNLSKNAPASPDVSIIIALRNEVDNLERTIKSIVESKNSLAFEIIIVDDGSIDGSCDFLKQNEELYGNVTVIYSDTIGAAKCKNIGAINSKGKYLFFCDAHIEVPDNWLDTLVKTLNDLNAQAIVPAIKSIGSDYKGYGGTWNNKLNFTWLDKPSEDTAEIPLAPGCAFGIKRDVFESVQGFDTNLQVYGVEDQELSLKLWLFGYKIVVDSAVEVGHLFKVNNSYKITYADIMYNYLCLCYFHFSDNNFSKAIVTLSQNKLFTTAAAKALINQDLMNQRKDYFCSRKYDDDWFFNKFNIEL